MQSSCKAHKILFLAILTSFLILGKIQVATIVGDVTDLQQRHHLILLEDQRLSTKGKIVSKCYNISKTPGRGSIHPPRTTVGI